MALISTFPGLWFFLGIPLLLVLFGKDFSIVSIFVPRPGSHCYNRRCPSGGSSTLFAKRRRRSERFCGWKRSYCSDEKHYRFDSNVKTDLPFQGLRRKPCWHFLLLCPSLLSRCKRDLWLAMKYRQCIRCPSLGVWMRMKHPVAKHRTNEPRTATVLSLFARSRC